MKRNSPKTKPVKTPNGSRAKSRELTRLYLADETAWLEQMAELIQAQRYDQLDYENLAEYLRDMAKRERREVFHRLTTLLMHLLRWDHQPDMRSRSWELTIRVQRHELQDLSDSKTLRNHLVEVLPKAYARARHYAALETELPESRFPAECPYTPDDLLAEE
jgi:Domain of unknown function DUF29